MGFKETMTCLEKCITRIALVALSAPPPGVINCVCVCVSSSLVKFAFILVILILALAHSLDVGASSGA